MTRRWALLLARLLAAVVGVVVLVVGLRTSTSIAHPNLQPHPVREVEEDCHQQLVLARLLEDAEDPADEPAPAPTAAAGSARLVSTQETVRITGPTGKTVEAVARIDTGAARSSIDDDLAEELEFDLENAETVRVVSSLGAEERPLVDGELAIGGQVKETQFNVTDRDDRSNPVLIGRRDLVGFQVVVSEG
jgi:hypothetical protein